MKRIKFMILAIISISLAVSSVSFGQDKKIDQKVSEILSKITEIRHDLHQNPEFGFEETRTAEIITKHLKSLGFEVQSVATTGVVGILKGGKKGTVIGVRADMDGLPVTEKTDFPWKSTVRGTYLGKDVGKMHACGHDLHVAIQMGVAEVLASMKKDIPGTIKFFFQPAEEGPGGGEPMVKAGVMENPKVEAVFALHVAADVPVGQVGYASGPALASSDSYRIKVKGKQAHGAAPHLSIDPVVTASQIVLALQTIRSRNLDPLEPSVITVGKIQGGTRSNIIPMDVEMIGTVRTYNPEVQDIIEKRMEEITASITKSAGAGYEFEYNRGYAPTINNPELSAWSAKSIARIIGKDNVIEGPPTMGAEDFSYFAQVAPGFMYWLGANNLDHPSGDHHTPTFRADDGSIEIGMKVMANLLLDYLKENK